ncbi:MAG: glycosyltransferase, partial [Candidatus Eisenbacteria bacterium]
EEPDESREVTAARAWRDRFHASLIRPLWLVAGRLESQKGHGVLLDALAEVWKRGLDFTLAIAGDGALRGALEQRAQELGLAHKIHFLGQLEDIGPLFAAADAVVLPSLWEGLPLTLLEAMVRARPVVATTVGGIPEVVIPGENGQLVPPNDALALADALELYHRKSDHAMLLGQAGAELVRLEYTWQAVVEGFEAVYDEVLGLAQVTPQSPATGRGGAR